MLKLAPHIILLLYVCAHLPRTSAVSTHRATLTLFSLTPRSGLAQVFNRPAMLRCRLLPPSSLAIQDTLPVYCVFLRVSLTVLTSAFLSRSKCVHPRLPLCSSLSDLPHLSLTPPTLPVPSSPFINDHSSRQRSHSFLHPTRSQHTSTNCRTKHYAARSARLWADDGGADCGAHAPNQGVCARLHHVHDHH